MKHASRLAISLLLAGALAGCDSIGDGNTIEALDLRVSGIESFEQGLMVDLDTATERYRMYDCFCGNLAALATFNDGGLANFNNRVEFTSSDPTVAEVLNFDDEVSELCPLAQNSAGMVIPKGTGQTTVTAVFGPLRASLVIEVADTAAAGTYVLRAAPPADPDNTDIGVGAALPMRVTGTFDGRTRSLNRNVTEWSFADDPDADFASVDTIGVVRGVERTAASPKTLQATFATCSSVSPTVLVNVGDILEPLTLTREAPDFATDGLLAVNTDEELNVHAPLDFDGDGTADGEQLVNQQVLLAFTDSCTLREFDSNVPTSNCRETATTCTNTVRLCTSGQTTCVSTMEACRTAAPPIQIGASTNQIIAFNDNGAPTNFTARFPDIVGEPTTLSGAIDATTTTLEVAELDNYPDVPPWFATIDADGTREDVRVTAVEGTTLTVERGIGATTAVAHADGVSFGERTYFSDPNDPLPITGKEGTLTVVAIDPPGTLAPLGTLQLRAEGTFVDEASASRQQRVTRLIAPEADAVTLIWATSDPTVATVSRNNGLMTSQDICGGRVTIRARADSSTDDSTEVFDPDTTAEDDACENTDPLCDQVEVCIEAADPLPSGVTCETPTTCP